MKFFKNFRVTTAIRIISFFAMFAILVISIIGISDMNKINSNMDKMYKDRLLPSTKAADIRRDFILARMEATEAIFNNKSDADSAIQGYYKNINTNVDSLEQSFMPNDEKKIMADIKNGLTSYKQVWDVLNTNLKSGAKLSEDDINVEAKTADATIKRLGDLVKYNVDEANRLNNDGNTVYNNSKNIFITIGIGSYLILIILSFLIVGTIKLSIKGIGENLAKVSEGDFTIKIEDDTKNEFGKMNKLLMQMVQNVSSMMKSVKNNSDEIMSHAETLSAISEEMASSSQEVATTIQDVAGGANDQAKEIAQVNDTLNGFGDNMGEIVKAVKDVDSNAKTINKMSLESNEDMNVVAKSIEEIGIGFKDTKDKVSSLGLDISNINEITNLIMSISEQTNLLALNAAIEAARAGESGRGFAVVADEIRKLAEKSKESSENISALVGKITEKSNAVINTTENVNDKLNSQVEIIGNSIESFKKIVNAVGEILPKIENINKSVLNIDEEKNKIINNMETVSASAEEMSASSEEIAASMEEMNASSEEVASSAEKLNFKAKAMRETVEQFKLD